MLHVQDVGEADGGEEGLDVGVGEDCKGGHRCGVLEEVREVGEERSVVL